MQKLKEVRDRLGLSRLEMSKLTKVTPQTIYNYETGRFSPSSDYFSFLDEIGVNLSYLCGTSNSVYQDNCDPYSYVRSLLNVQAQEK